MSRIGRSPIEVPGGVTVTVDGPLVTVAGPQGTLARQLPGAITVRQEEANLIVERPDDQRQNRALHGLTRSPGGQHGDRGHRRIHQGTRDRGRRLPGRGPGPGSLELALGFSHPVLVDALEGVTFDVPTPTRIVVKGIDKEKVGQVAADIRKLRKPEPYKGKGVRYLGERVMRKAGKAAK